MWTSDNMNAVAQWDSSPSERICVILPRDSKGHRKGLGRGVPAQEGVSEGGGYYPETPLGKRIARTARDQHLCVPTRRAAPRLSTYPVLGPGKMLCSTPPLTANSKKEFGVMVGTRLTSAHPGVSAIRCLMSFGTKSIAKRLIADNRLWSWGLRERAMAI